MSEHPNIDLLLNTFTPNHALTWSDMEAAITGARRDRIPGIMLGVVSGEIATFRAKLEPEVRALVAEVERLRPFAELPAGFVRQDAEMEYRNASCDDCMCCSLQQCRERRCRTNSIGESICPCTEA